MARKIAPKTPQPQPRIGGKKDEYPVFCFRYFDITCLKGCPQKQLQSFVERLHRLSVLGWSEIRRSGRHEYGREYLPKDAIKQVLPPIITDDVSKVMVFRYDNENHPFIGVQTENTIQLIALEVRFGELYDHG